MRVAVDRSRCQGYANCLSAAPDVFDLDESGLAVALIEQPTPELHEAARAAARLCPVAAIEISEDHA